MIKMPEVNNTELIRVALKALYKTAARRTTQSFAIAVIDSIIRTLNEKYDFLKNVHINPDYGSGEFIEIDTKINKIHPAKIGKVVEAIIQIVSFDLKEKAGHFFIKEVKINSGEEIILKLRECGVDLDLLMLQQQYLYRRQNKDKSKNDQDNKIITSSQSLDNISLLGYTEENISSWRYDSNNKVCIIFDKDGKELDRLNLDTIIRGYIGTLTNEGNIIFSEDNENKKKIKKIDINEKEFELLKILYARDVDIKTATEILKVSEKELNYMVHRLLALEMLHYSSDDEVVITKSGINHLKQSKNNN
jgi:hypothetical protein